jgi:TolB-like protein
VHNGAAGAGSPTVAILPFQDLSAKRLPDHVPAGLLDGLTYALSRFRSLCVITPASSARYGGALEDPAAIAAALGADILVGGSVMAAPDGRLRLRWRAYAVASNAMLAAGDLEGALEALWDFQEDAAAAIAVEVEPRAQAEALRARASSPTTSASAYDLYLQGLFAGFSLERRDAAEALALFQSAIEIDPRFHPALAMAPWAAAYSNAIASPEDLARYAQMSRDALRIGRNDARTQATAGTALFYMAHEFEPARAAIDRALTLNPNEYTAWICGGWMHAMKGETAQAHRMFDQAERLNPLAYGANGLMSGRAMAEFMAGRIADAERFIVRALSGDDSHPSALMTGMATAAELDLTEPLSRRREAFLAIYPAGLDDLAIRALPFEDIRCRRAYFGAVGKALGVGPAGTGGKGP